MSESFHIILALREEGPDAESEIFNQTQRKLDSEQGFKDNQGGIQNFQGIFQIIKIVTYLFKYLAY